MFHTDPEFRGLLLRIAEGNLSEAAVLADLLEERGDERAKAVRRGLLAFRQDLRLPDGRLLTIWSDNLRDLQRQWEAIRWEHDYREPGHGRVIWKEPERIYEKDAIRHILTLFPEGPRWRVEAAQQLFGFPVRFGGVYLVPTEARTQGLPLDAHVVGPEWPTAPSQSATSR